MRPRALLVTATAVVLAAACSSASKLDCTVGADCASGACDSSGRCVPVSHPDGGGGDSGIVGDGASMSDVFIPPTDGGGCAPNHDGTIDRAEVPLQAGLRATYRIATNATVNTAGTMMGGTRVWDELTTPYGKFQVERVQVVLTRTVGGFPTTTRTFVFISECFGPVANIVSQSNEATVEFTSAAEVRRLAP